MLYLLLGAWLVAADKECKCNRDNMGKPAENDMDPDYGMYCKKWDLETEFCQGEDQPEWCDMAWCYVDKDCEDAQLTAVFNRTELYWSYSACKDENLAICMAYSKPTPKIKPCPDKDGGDMCAGKKRAQCMKEDKCTFDRKEKKCMMEGEKEECKDCKCKEEKPSPVTVKNNLPWGGTQSPDYWYNCVSKWCSKFVWMGGMEQCHYDMKYGCGCEDMKYEECMSDMDCCWAGKETGCQEVVECPRLTFSECLANSDKCSPCGDGGCGYNCKMGPGQSLSGFQSLTLDNNCNCKVTQMF